MVTVSIGAMIGSGIFVLPGLAFKIAGPAVVLAYLLAGLVVLPAALSKAELGTAMPEAGGTYLYIDRAMGPFFGTIAGLGAWFSLTFESAVTVARAADRIQAMVDASADADIAIVGTSAHHLVYDVLFGTVPDRLVERLDCTVLLTHSGRPRRHTFLRAVIDRFIF